MVVLVIFAGIRAGIGLTAWNAAKRANAPLRERIASARDDWARLRHAQHAAALYSSQTGRAAGRKALKPQPIHQAKLVVRHLTVRVPLNFAAIPEEEISAACERVSLSLDTRIRGQQPQSVTEPRVPVWEPNEDESNASGTG
ncbi:MAG: hypothetical protein DLM73_02965 [Chthoniobacterales bacterium]|nr:MAG: hypothetical protein DLM73_02965 [Chthoniobacterales bacterium]